MGRFDFVQTVRVLTNLVENAMKYAPIDTPIDVHAFARNGRLVFEVLDRGPGIAPELRGRLFEPFSRAEVARPDTGSAGLGLSIAKRLVEAQQGTIAYVPRPEGGACFTFDFPLVTIRSS
jgi:two-component system sensor histidine kinase KdpD